MTGFSLIPKTIQKQYIYNRANASSAFCVLQTGRTSPSARHSQQVLWHVERSLLYCIQFLWQQLCLTVRLSWHFSMHFKESKFRQRIITTSICNIAFLQWFHAVRKHSCAEPVNVLLCPWHLWAQTLPATVIMYLWWGLQEKQLIWWARLCHFTAVVIT